MGISIPFIMGFGMVVFFPDLWGEHFKGGILFFAMFMGTALSISALPVIARTLMDLNLMKTDLETVITGAATIDDLVGWSLFAFILSNFAHESIMSIPPYMTFILVILLFVFMLTIGRSLARKAQKLFRSDLPWPGSFLGITTVLTLPFFSKILCVSIFYLITFSSNMYVLFVDCFCVFLYILLP